MASTYNNTQELLNKKKQLEQQLKSIEDTSIKQLKQALLPVYKKNLHQAYVLFYAEYKALAYTTFQEVFQQEYGKGNYIPESLNKAISVVEDGFTPSLRYNMSLFKVRPYFVTEKEAFNHNTRDESSFIRNMEFEAIDALEEASFFGLSFSGMDSPYEFAEEQNGYSWDEDIKVFQDKNVVIEPKEIFQKAENIFHERWILRIPQLAETIYKKYSIQI